MTKNKIAFTMKIDPKKAREYKFRHDEIWPELKDTLKEAGIQDYSIFLDEETGVLFAVLICTNSVARSSLPQKPIVQKWWEYMAPLMDIHLDNSPIEKNLALVFHLD